MKANKLVFHVMSDEFMGMMLNLTPKKYWDENECAYDQHFDVSDMPDFVYPTPEMEGMWTIIEEMTIEDAKNRLIEHGFIFDEEYWNFMQSFII